MGYRARKDEMRCKEVASRVFPGYTERLIRRDLQLTRWATAQLCQRSKRSHCLLPALSCRILQDAQVNHWLCQEEPPPKARRNTGEMAASGEERHAARRAHGALR